MRQSILVLISILGLSASACGGAPAPDAEMPGAPGDGAGAAARGADTCVTPEGASAEAPPDCGPGCEWKPEELKCSIKRGIIVDDQAPPPTPVPPPPTE